MPFKARLDNFEDALTDPKKWAHPGIGQFFSRREEADAHNQPIRAAREAERQAYKEEREARRVESELQQESAYKSALAEAERKLLNDEEVNDKEINGKSLILQMFRENLIDVPLKTQGWIKASLHSIQCKGNGHASWSFSGNKSRTIGDLIRNLHSTIEEKYRGMEIQTPENAPGEEDSEECEFE